MNILFHVRLRLTTVKEMVADSTIGSAQVQDQLPHYTRLEVSKHKKLEDCWIVLHGEVYNVTSWLKRHPGGVRVIRHYAGEDASVSGVSALLSACKHMSLEYWHFINILDHFWHPCIIWVSRITCDPNN